MRSYDIGIRLVGIRRPDKKLLIGIHCQGFGYIVNRIFYVCRVAIICPFKIGVSDVIEARRVIIAHDHMILIYIKVV